MADYVDALLEQTAINTAFNASQADINRDWQEYMSGTSHQREVADLMAAGLNPVLSANSGSSWQSVANASADPSSAQGMANLAATYMNNKASIEMSKIQAGATVAAASSAAAIQAQATRDAAAINGEYGMDIATINKGGTPAGLIDKYAGGLFEQAGSALGGLANSPWSPFGTVASWF